ncbi:anti-sigma factor antagonist [Streptomyces sp. NTH33]|uniref:STAS domain-containing protein n=1 Tax=Streptomyces sp. NTH33 TaxID=1735453 RepID=UPI000DAACD5F|nr:STAS domain-containing protein [Streptomyces sp. NTH33]PZH13106.1 anti-sigma factor antagonist [Streptomyces sp. NTH33]
MSAPLPEPFGITVAETGPTVLTARVAGELDYNSGDELVDTVSELLARPGPAGVPWQDLRLDFAELTRLDSMGLPALLMIRRRTGAARVGLHLDNRPGFLDRMLTVTHTYDHLTEPPARGQDAEAAEADAH